MEEKRSIFLLKSEAQSKDLRKQWNHFKQIDKDVFCSDERCMKGSFTKASASDYKRAAAKQESEVFEGDAVGGVSRTFGCRIIQR